MATTQSSYEESVAYLVRSLGFSPEPFHLTTGTFNLVVKDRTAFRLSGAYSVQDGNACMGRTLMSDNPEQNPPVLETL
jgi:hypothetical protein